MRYHHTKNKGDLGVLKVQLDLYEKGYLILTPNTEHAAFDLVAYKDGIFKRVQVKYWAAKNDVITVPFKTSWADKNGNHTKKYDKNEIDLMCIYCPDTDKCYYIVPLKCGNAINLRLSKPKSHQKANIHMADDYLEIPDWQLVQAPPWQPPHKNPIIPTVHKKPNETPQHRNRHRLHGICSILSLHRVLQLLQTKSLWEPAYHRRRMRHERIRNGQLHLHKHRTNHRGSLWRHSSEWSRSGSLR